MYRSEIQKIIEYLNKFIFLQKLILLQNEVVF